MTTHYITEQTREAVLEKVSQITERAVEDGHSYRVINHPMMHGMRWCTVIVEDGKE